MAAEPLPPPDSLDEDEDGGGPVKPFLDHLEDLRWTIIKVLAAVVLSMMLCLVAGNQLVLVLKWPLRQAQDLIASTNRIATVRWGDSVLGKIPVSGLPTNLVGHDKSVSLMVSLVPDGNEFKLVVRPDTNAPVESVSRDLVPLKNYGPIGGLTVALDIALYGGIALSFPFILLFIGQFVVPALKKKEKRFLYRAVGIGIGLFLTGVAFCYFVLMQVTLLATVQFSQWLGFLADEWRAEDYIDFVIKMMLAVGLSFQLPVVVLTLVRIGILDYKKLKSYRSYFIVANMVVCAVVTPSGDPFTMLLLAVPVQVLYEISVFIAKGWWRREQRELAAMEQAAGSS